MHDKTQPFSVQCAVYKGSRKADSYLYVPGEDDFSRVPVRLLDMLGKPELVLTVELTPQRRLAQADVREVVACLKSQGYYLQLPPAVPGREQ